MLESSKGVYSYDRASVSPLNFGIYLNSLGFVIGAILAWVITIGEIVSGTILAVGHKVKQCAIFHTLIVASGIILLHLSNEWLVVGHCRNGIEYSVLILAVLLVLYARND
jgi:putative oxidoreductase